MEQVTEFIKNNDGTCLYVMFALQCCCVVFGFPLMLFACSSTEKRLGLSYGKWTVKWMVLCFIGKWMIDTYDLVELQQLQDESGKSFDPYKLLHMQDDGSFDTKKIHQAYDRLANKYHPNVVNPEKVPKDKALKRWQNLNKAMETLTNKEKFEIYQTYGDPEGSKTVIALWKGYPTFLTDEDAKPMMITGAFCCGIFGLLALSLLAKGDGGKTAAGIEKDSKPNMKEMIVAILEDNSKSERTIGFSDADIVEVLEQSVEIMLLNEQMGKKGSFSDVCMWMAKKAAENQNQMKEGGGCCGGEDGPATPDSIVGQFLPKLTETLIEILAEAPFAGKSTLTVGDKAAFKYKSELVLTTILAWTLRTLGGKAINKRKIYIEAPKTAKSGEGIPLVVRIEKLPFVKATEKNKIWLALVNYTDNSMTLHQFASADAIVEKKFQVEPQPVGTSKFRAYVISSDGQIEKGKDKEVTVA